VQPKPPKRNFTQEFYCVEYYKIHPMTKTHPPLIRMTVRHTTFKSMWKLSQNLKIDSIELVEKISKRISIYAITLHNSMN
jgi:hypothetical protein